MVRIDKKKNTELKDDGCRQGQWEVEGERQ